MDPAKCPPCDRPLGMKMLIGLFIFCCSGVQRSVANKESKSFPPTQQGDFQPHATLKSESKRKRQRLGKDKGVRVCVCLGSFCSAILFLCVCCLCVRSHFLCGQCEFTFHHKKKTTPAFLICLNNTTLPPTPLKEKQKMMDFYLRRNV